jgi:hypothetical protein
VRQLPSPRRVRRVCADMRKCAGRTPADSIYGRARLLQLGRQIPLSRPVRTLSTSLRSGSWRFRNPRGAQAKLLVSGLWPGRQRLHCCWSTPMWRRSRGAVEAALLFGSPSGMQLGNPEFLRSSPANSRSRRRLPGPHGGCCVPGRASRVGPGCSPSQHAPEHRSSALPLAGPNLPPRPGSTLRARGAYPLAPSPGLSALIIVP